MDTRTVRRAIGAGRWFPADRRQLQQMVGQYIDHADAPAMPGRITAAIAPHAGYIYSGPVAGYVFRALRDNAAAAGAPDTAVLLGFSHRAAFRGVALMDGASIATPLGNARLDADAANVLTAASQRIVAAYEPHNGEHSAENEIPFAQIALPDCGLVVGLIGDHDDQTLDELVRALGHLAARKRIVVIASSDMLHDPDYERVRRTDRATLARVAALDWTGVRAAWSPDQQVFCGIGPVTAAMRYAEERGCRAGTVLHYRNSGDDYPESRGEWVVGYGAVAFATAQEGAA